jgi:hypothetical protein
MLPEKRMTLTSVHAEFAGPEQPSAACWCYATVIHFSER